MVKKSSMGLFYKYRSRSISYSGVQGRERNRDSAQMALLYLQWPTRQRSICVTTSIIHFGTSSSAFNSNTTPEKLSSLSCRRVCIIGLSKARHSPSVPHEFQS